MKMKNVDRVITLVFIAALVIIYFFWGCRLDLYVTIVAGIILALAGMTTYLQNKKIKELEPEETK